MAANTNPIYSGTPHVGWTVADGDGGTAGPVKTSSAALDGTAGVTTVFTAGTNGSYLQKLTAKAAGTNVASVARVYVNNGSSNASSGNNALVDEMSLPATTASAAGALQKLEIPLNYAIPAGYKVMVSLGTTVAAGWTFSLPAGDY